MNEEVSHVTIKLIAVFFWLSSILYSISGTYLLIVLTAMRLAPSALTFIIILSFVAMAELLIMAAGVGLWRMQNWGRMLALQVCVLTTILYIPSILSLLSATAMFGGKASIISLSTVTVTTLVVANLLIIHALAFNKDVKAVFLGAKQDTYKGPVIHQYKY
jgi:hypothetical protein